VRSKIAVRSKIDVRTKIDARTKIAVRSKIDVRTKIDVRSKIAVRSKIDVRTNIDMRSKDWCGMCTYDILNVFAYINTQIFDRNLFSLYLALSTFMDLGNSTIILQKLDLANTKISLSYDGIV